MNYRYISSETKRQDLENELEFVRKTLKGDIDLGSDFTISIHAFDLLSDKEKTKLESIFDSVKVATSKKIYKYKGGKLYG